MNRLLKLELIKLKYYPTFWILTGIAFGFYVLILYAGTQINFNIEGIDSQVYLRFPVVWQSMAYYSSWFNLLLALLMIILTANDFVFRIFRQHVIDGLTKQEIFISKLQLIVLFAFVAFAVNFLAGFFVGSIFTAGYDLFFSDFYFVLLYFINVIGIMSIAFLISVLLKNTGASIVVFIGMYLFELILRGYFVLMSLDFGNFLPFKVFSNLCPAPSLKKMISDPLIKQSIEQSIQSSYNWEMSVGMNATVVLLYIVLFLYLSYYLLQKRDL
ncbi:MAG: ABC transporter permease subunit [Bacteroidales bacterium]|nr:ABC transporter permease subunit [Bacteroidales bacterium]